MNTVAIIQARMASSRLPGKVMKSLKGFPVLDLLIRRLKRAKCLDGLIIATTCNPTDDVLVELASFHEIGVVRGDELDVLSRFATAISLCKADIVVRVTGDCPLIDPEIIDKAVEVVISEPHDYYCCGNEGGYPRGVNAELASAASIVYADKNAVQPFEREHVTAYIYTRAKEFKCANAGAPKEIRRPDYRLCVDESADLQMLRALLDAVETDPLTVDTRALVNCLDHRSDLVSINASIKQKHLSDFDARWLGHSSE